MDVSCRQSGDRLGAGMMAVPPAAGLISSARGGADTVRVNDGADGPLVVVELGALGCVTFAVERPGPGRRT